MQLKLYSCKEYEMKIIACELSAENSLMRHFQGKSIKMR